MPQSLDNSILVFVHIQCSFQLFDFSHNFFRLRKRNGRFANSDSEEEKEKEECGEEEDECGEEEEDDDDSDSDSDEHSSRYYYLKNSTFLDKNSGRYFI